MNKENPLVTTETQVDHAPRLRVDTAGLSEETRRELGLVEFEAAGQMPPTGCEGGTTSHPGTAAGLALREGDQTVNTKEVSKATPAQAEAGAILPASAFPEEKQRAGSEARLEEGSNPKDLEHHLAPARETKEEGRRHNEEAPSPNSNGPSLESDPAGRFQDFDKSQDGGDQSRESQFPAGEGRQWAQGGEQSNEAGSWAAKQGQEFQDPKPGGETFGEGYHQTLAGGAMLPRPGRARSGAGASRPEDVPALERERPPAGQGRPATDPREETERWRELQATVKQNLAHNQQTHAAMLQALRDAARLQAAQRAELDRLAAQVRRLLGQSENAGFNRQ